MTRIVLTCDSTLLSDFRQLPLGPFLSCAPVEKVPELLFNWVAHLSQSIDGTAIYAPYGLRKVEAALLQAYKPSEVVVAHPSYVGKFIDKDTKIVAISTMDPLGFGPVSMMFTMGGLLTAYSKKRFFELVKRTRRAENGCSFKLVVGGSGAWQFEHRRDLVESLGIDHIVEGEIDHIAGRLFNDLEDGFQPTFIRVKGGPQMSEIPAIVKPSMQGLVEVMRGCGRNCEFCDMNLRFARYVDPEKVVKEIEVNVKAGFEHVWVHSDDIFLYRLEDHKTFYPNREAVLHLFHTIVNTPGVAHSNPTHGTVAPAAADPDLIIQLSKVLKAGPDTPIGIQAGVETGSPRLMAKYMPLKAKPFSPEEWMDVVFEGTKVFNENYWFPAYTIVIGLPQETAEDAWDTVRMIDKIERELPEKVGSKAHFTVTPLSFIPVGVLSDKEFFNIAETIDESRFAVLYRSWRHSVLELERLPSHIFKFNPFFRPLFHQFVKLGARAILWGIKRWGEKMGFDPEKAFTKV